MLASFSLAVPPPKQAVMESLVPPSNIDAKLLHLVQKIVTTHQQHQKQQQQKTNSSKKNHEATTNPPTVLYVMHCLRTQNVEYQRKNYNKLKIQVKETLQFVLAAAAAAAAADGDEPNKKESRSKRSRNKSKDAKCGGEEGKKDGEDVEEVDSEEEADRKLDAQREAMLSKNGSCALNASLRLRYEKLQRERDAEAAAAVASAAAAVVLEREEVGEVKELKDTASDPSTPGTTPTKSRKRKLSDRRKSSGKSGKRPTTTGSTFTPFDNEDDDNSGNLCRPVPRPKERYADLGGMDHILQQIRELIEYPLVRPELYAHLGVGPPRGILLRGPPGTGKSHLANAIAGQLGVNYFKVSAPELVSGMSGESEGRIRDLFRAAAESAPSIVFMDELDAIAPKRNEGGSSRGMEKRMVAQLLTSMDADIDPSCTRGGAPVIVLGATNRPDALDSALRRAGRFDKEILMGVPNEAARQKILQTMTKSMRLSGDFDYKVLARKTPGYVGADVRSLTKEAAVIAINRIFRDVLLETDLNRPAVTAAVVGTTTTTTASVTVVDKLPTISEQEGPSADATVGENVTCGGPPQLPPPPPSTDTVRPLQPLTQEQLEPLYVTMEDFLNAIPLVQPSGQREGFAVAPDVSWKDIGAMDEIREEMAMSVLEPIRNPEKFKLLGLSLPAGVLLYGPPGCGKTLLAKAVANESGANFISVKGPELLDKYVGESEKAVRLVFERARSSSPCIVFFDELDSLCPKRGSDGGGSGVSERVVNQLLTEMDGLESRRSVFVIAATNRPELIDPAMMRPGRLDKLLYVPLPSADDRVSILTALSTKVKFGSDVVLDSIGRSHKADGFSGADCAALLREAGLAVLKEDMAACISGNGKTDAELCIEARHFEVAFHHVMPSVSTKDQARYDRIRNRMARARSRGTVSDGEATNGSAIADTLERGNSSGDGDGDAMH